MAKKHFGKFIALATVSGVIAAGISYFLKYKSFHDELDEDFHDFEGDEDDFDGELPHESEIASRTYVSLNEKKETAAASEEEQAPSFSDTVSEPEADAMEELVKSVIRESADAVQNAAESSDTMIEEILDEETSSLN